MGSYREHTKGIFSTMIFHAIIGILFMIFGYSTPLPLPEEEGILINFGESDEGFGQIEPRTSESVQDQTSAEETKSVPEPEMPDQEGNITQDYEEVINNYGLEQWVSKDFDYKEFTKGLESIQAMPLCDGCLKGGGRTDCEIRTCATNKNINDCSECKEPEACENTEILEVMRTGARNAGLLVKTMDVDGKELLEKWIPELKIIWPSSILFLDKTTR